MGDLHEYLPPKPGASMLAPSGLTYEEIAAVCHEANRRYCATQLDYSQPEWHDAPAWQRESAVAGVSQVVEGTVNSPRESHEAWLAQKRDAGWTWGPEKDAGLKTHPCCMPYDDLPVSQRRKDALFFAIVQALAAG